MSHKILIFGSSGMLGTYVSKYLKEQGHKVINSNREDLDLTDANEKLLESLLHNVDYAINCAGVIIPRIESQGDVNTLLVNSIFPRILANACKITKTKCFHISTDGVFDGKVGNYNEQSAISINPNDFYGYTKLESSYERCQRCQSCHATIYPLKQVTIKQITYVYCVLYGIYGTLGVVSSDDIALGFASCYITLSTAPLVPYITYSTVTVHYLFNNIVWAGL